MQKFDNTTSSGDEKAIKIGSSAPSDSVALAWFKSDSMNPKNTVSVVDLSDTIPENKISETSGEAFLAYADELGVLRRLDGSYDFKTNNLTVSDITLSRNPRSGLANINYVDAADFTHYKYVSKYFISANNNFSISSEEDFLPASALGDLSIKVVDKNGSEYIDIDKNRKKYRILLEPFRTDVNVNRSEIPHKIVVLFDADPPTNLKLIYDKVSCDEDGNVFDQQLAYSETVNAVPFYKEIAEESYVLDSNNYKKNIFSIKKINEKYNTLVNKQNVDNGYQVIVPEKAFLDYRTFEVFNWRIIAKTKFTTNFDEINSGDELDQNNIVSKTVNVGVLYSSRYQKTNSSINPYIFQRLEKSPFNLFRYSFVNPISESISSSDKSRADYWKVDIDSIGSLNDFDFLVWSPSSKISKDQARKIRHFLNNNKTILLDLSNCRDASAIDSALAINKGTVSSNYVRYNSNSPLISKLKGGAWDLSSAQYADEHYGIFGSKNVNRYGVNFGYKSFRYFSSNNAKFLENNAFVYSGFTNTSTPEPIALMIPYFNSNDRLSRGNVIATTFPFLEYCNNIYATSTTVEAVEDNYGDVSLDDGDSNYVAAAAEGPFKFLFNCTNYANYCAAHANRKIDTRSAYYNFVSPWNSSWVMNEDALLPDEKSKYFVKLFDSSNQVFLARDLLRSSDFSILPFNSKFIKNPPSKYDGSYGSGAYGYYRREITKFLPKYKIDQISLDPEDVEIYVEVTNPDVQVHNADLISSSFDQEDVNIISEDIPSAYLLYKLRDVRDSIFALTDKYSPSLRVPTTLGRYIISERPLRASGEAQLKNGFNIMNVFKSYKFDLACTYSYVDTPIEKESEFKALVDIDATAFVSATLTQPQEDKEVPVYDWVPDIDVGTSKITESESQPSNPSNGDVWFKPSTNESYVYYDDGDNSDWYLTNGSFEVEVGDRGTFSVDVEFEEETRYTEKIIEGEEVKPVSYNNKKVTELKAGVEDLGLNVVAKTSSPTNIFPYTGDIDLGNKTSAWIEGNRGDYVNYIQFTLWTYNNYHGGNRNYYPYDIDGYYGPKTKEGVRLFQQAEGARYVDGIVDSETKWLMARLWINVYNNRRDIWDASYVYFSSFRGNGYMVAAKDTVTADQINSGKPYRKITFTGTTGPGKGVDYIFFKVPNVYIFTQLAVSTDGVFHNLSITEWGLSASFHGGDTSKYFRRSCNLYPAKNRSVLNQAGKILIDVPNYSKDKALYMYIKVEGGRMPMSGKRASKYGSKAEGFGITAITASGHKPGYKEPDKIELVPYEVDVPVLGEVIDYDETYEQVDIEYIPQEDIVTSVQILADYELRNYAVFNNSPKETIKVGVDRKRVFESSDLIKRTFKTDGTIKVPQIKYNNKTYEIDEDYYHLHTPGKRSFDIPLDNGDTLTVDLRKSPSKMLSISSSLSKVIDLKGVTVWESGDPANDSPITLEQQNFPYRFRGRTHPYLLSGAELTASTSELYFADATVVTAKEDVSGYFLKSASTNAILYRDSRDTVDINDGVLLICDSRGNSFGIPSPVSIMQQAAGIDSSADISLGSYILTNAVEEPGFIYGFYDNREKEFIGEEITYLELVDRGPRNIFIAVCAFDADGNTINDTDFVGPSRDTTFVPVNVPLKYVTPIYSVSVNESSSIGVGDMYEGLSKFDTWELPIKTGSFEKNIVLKGNFDASDWKSNYSGQTILARYSTITDLNSSWSKIFGYGHYDVLDESPILVDERTIKLRRTPVLAWNHPSTYEESVFGVVRPEVKVYSRDFVDSEWELVSSDDIRDINCYTGNVTFKQPIVPAIPNLIKVSYSVKNKDILLNNVDGNPVPLNPIINSNEIRLNEALYVYITPQEVYKQNDMIVGIPEMNLPISFVAVDEYEPGSPINFTYDKDIFNPSSSLYDPLALVIAIIYVSDAPNKKLPDVVDVRTRGGGVTQDKSNYELLKENNMVLSNWDVYSALGQAYAKGGYVIIRIPEEVKDNFLDEKEIYDIIGNNLTAGVAYELQDMNGEPWS